MIKFAPHVATAEFPAEATSGARQSLAPPPDAFASGSFMNSPSPMLSTLPGQTRRFQTSPPTTDKVLYKRVAETFCPSLVTSSLLIFFIPHIYVLEPLFGTNRVECGLRWGEEPRVFTQSVWAPFGLWRRAPSSNVTVWFLPFDLFTQRI